MNQLFKGEVMRISISGLLIGGLILLSSTAYAAPTKGLLSMGLGNTYGVIGFNYQVIIEDMIGLTVGIGKWPAENSRSKAKVTGAVSARFYLTTPAQNALFIGGIYGPTRRGRSTFFSVDQVYYGVGPLVGYSFIGKTFCFIADVGVTHTNAGWQSATDIAFDIGVGITF